LLNMIGTLRLEPARDRSDLLAPPVAAALEKWSVPDVDVSEVKVAEIDPELADTAAFCERYGVGLAESANCVIVAGKRGSEVRYAACVVLATTRADINGVVRRRINARKASFAPMETAISETGMEYGGITPIGLPADWPIFIDSRVVEVDPVVVGAGLRRAKIALPGRALAGLPNAEVIEGLAG